MKEVKFNGYIRSYGIRATGADLHIIRDLHDKLNPAASQSLEPYQCEVTVRIIDSRQQWIDKYFALAKRHARAGDFIIKHCKETCVVIPVNYVGDTATSAPRHGDKYDYKTGVAVAFAKAYGDRVPDYI